MKTIFHKPPMSQSQSGSAVLVVLVLLFLMVALLLANNKALTVLHANMRIVEKQQLKHSSAPTIPSTNAPALKP